MFAAVEAEILLHHAAETLLRFVHAHAVDSPCPWMRMSSEVSFKAFKKWVGSQLVTAPVDARVSLCEALFTPGDAESAERCAEYVGLLANYFLDAGSYNAAKHGMSVRGSANRLVVTVGDDEILNHDGAMVEWLQLRPRGDDAQAKPRWTKVNRVAPTEALVALIYLTTQFMEALWDEGRRRHLGETVDRRFRPMPLSQLMATQGLGPHPLIADLFEPLKYQDESPTIEVRSANFRVPTAPQASE
jgi:hypothetical protein